MYSKPLHLCMNLPCRLAGKLSKKSIQKPLLPGPSPQWQAGQPAVAANGDKHGHAEPNSSSESDIDFQLSAPASFQSPEHTDSV